MQMERKHNEKRTEMHCKMNRNAKGLQHKQNGNFSLTGIIL